MPTTPRKKLIEVALPLEAINEASAHEKMPGIGAHPRGIHLWWARRPLTTSRAVIFASLVDDPDSPDALPAFVEACRSLPKGKNATLNDTPRMRLFDFIETLVKWKSTTDKDVLQTARDLINIATEGNPPPLLDPFAGGGSIPLEAQRLGLEAHASDLNPVAVMINKAQIEIPPRFANQHPVNAEYRAQMFSGKSTISESGRAGRKNLANTDAKWEGAAGLAADVRYYGEWMREKALERIGHLYPTHNGETVIAWIWARTVKSPNPAVDVPVPLVRSFELSKKKGRRAWVEPRYNAETKRIVFTVKREQDGEDPKTIRNGTMLSRKGGICVVSGVPIPKEYIKSEALANRMGTQLIAIVTDGSKGRNYYGPTIEHEATASKAQPTGYPTAPLPYEPRAIWCTLYGLDSYDKLFTIRQLSALTTFSDLVNEVREQIHQDALEAGMSDDRMPLRENGLGAHAYAEAVSVYLAFGVDRAADFNNSIARWVPTNEKVMNLFARQAIPMAWDFAEANILARTVGSLTTCVDYISECIRTLPIDSLQGSALQQDAAQLRSSSPVIISTDPPYYDNIGYADLSDFFYVWLRRSLRDIYPDIFGTMLVPKTPELIASPYRHDGSREAANQHFESGMAQAFTNMCRFTDHRYPFTVYYAFKQSESDEDDGAEDANTVNNQASTGWETMLTGLIDAGYSINGTWPSRTEQTHRMIAMGTNALASSIVLVCRPRPDNASTISRRQFVDALRRELPEALKNMLSGNIAPVDLAQASIGPGMAIYSRYSKVLEADGSALTVRAALGLINQELDAYLAEQDGSIDPDTRFAVAWFEQFSFNEGEFGHADVLARAKNTSVAGVEAAGLVVAGRGKVRLKHWTEVDPGAWDPKADRRPTVWEAVHHLIERLNAHGESGAAGLLYKMPPEMAAEARALAYRLYSICERKGWAEHALEYNKLVVSWTGVADQAAAERAAEVRGDGTKQLGLFE